ncbi:MAG TPA: NAD(P)H-quinone oxidoreductase [Acidimicrobiia bacterium]|jgi:putative PIG3 family NAD(P)H quinone oxidoreductase
MRAVVAPGDGRIEVLDRPDPRPGPGQVVVAVAGAGLNRADLLQRQGLYPAPPGSPADIPGLEFSGEVIERGEGVATPIVGQRVFGVTGGGCQAERLAVDARHCALVPDAVDLAEAGAAPEVFVTAHDAMRTRAALQPGESVLVHAAGSGVGTAVVQLAKAWGCPVTGTARTAGKLDRAAELGLDHGIVPGDPFDPSELAAQLVNAAGALDVTIDLVGGPYVVADVLAAALLGRIVIVGMLAGGRADLPIGLVMGKRLAIHGTVLRARSDEHKAAAMRGFADEVVPLLADRSVAPIVDRTFPLEQAAQAYELLASDTTFGKVLLHAG